MASLAVQADAGTCKAVYLKVGRVALGVLSSMSTLWTTCLVPQKMRVLAKLFEGQ